MKKAGEIFIRLFDKTERGEIHWEETEKETEFQVAFPAYSIRIVSQEGQYAWPDYYLKIFNQEGKLIEELGEKDIADELIGRTARPSLAQLYEIARRIAMRVEDALDSILAELE